MINLLLKWELSRQAWHCIHLCQGSNRVDGQEMCHKLFSGQTDLSLSIYPMRVIIKYALWGGIWVTDCGADKLLQCITLLLLDPNDYKNNQNW